jgi:hypothetical protein
MHGIPSTSDPGRLNGLRCLASSQSGVLTQFCESNSWRSQMKRHGYYRPAPRWWYRVVLDRDARHAEAIESARDEWRREIDFPLPLALVCHGKRGTGGYFVHIIVPTRTGRVPSAIGQFDHMSTRRS